MRQRGTLFNILATAMGMTVTIMGIAFKTGYFYIRNPNSGYVLIVFGAFVTLYFLVKVLRN